MRFVPTLLLSTLTAFAVSCGQSGGTPPPAGGPSTPGPNAPENPTYPQAVFLLDIGETLAAQVPTVTNTPTSWSISPALPPGMTFNTLNGAISGTPTGYLQRDLFEVEAANSDGSDSAYLVLQVGGEARFAYGGSADDGAVAEFGVESDGGALFHQGWIGGSATGLLGVAGDLDGEVVCVVDSFMLTSYVADPATGRLFPGATLGLGNGPHSLAMTPSGNYVFVTTREQDRIRSYSVDNATGAFTLINERTTSFQPTEVIADPNGRYVIVRHSFVGGSGAGTPIRSYAVVPGTGQLVQTGVQTLLTVEATAMALDPVGENLYLTLSQPFETVLHLSVDPVLGTTSIVATANAGTGPIALRVAPDGQRLYVQNQGSADLTLFDIDTQDGSLTATTSIPTSAGTNGLSFSFDGSELYLVDSTAQEINTQAIDPLDGTFSFASALRTRAGTLPPVLVAGEQGIRRVARSLVSIHQGSSDVRSYTIDDTTGELSAGGLPPIASGTTPVSVAVDPQGRFAFVSNRDSNEIQTFGFLPSGHLEDLMISTATAAGQPGVLGAGPGGGYLFAYIGFFNLFINYAIQPDGALVAAGSQPMNEEPTSITVDPTGSFVYVTIGGDGTTSFGEIRPFQIAAADGSLTALPVVAATGFPTALAFDPSGRRAYATLRDADTAQGYDVDGDGGLTPIATGSLTQSEPTDIVLTRDGRFAYATFEDTISLGGLLLYDVDATTGQLFNSDTLAFQWRDSVAAGAQPQRLEVTPGGEFIYVLARSSDELQVFSAAPDGIATPVEAEPTGVLPWDLGMLVVVE